MAAYETYVAFYASKPPQHINPNLAGAALTIAELTSYGIGSVAISTCDPMPDDGTALCYPLVMSGRQSQPYAVDQRPMALTVGQGQHDQVRAVRSRIGTPELWQGRVPVVNDKAIRAIGASKAQQHDIFTGLMPMTTVVEPGMAITDEHLEPIPGDTVVIKIDRGKGGCHSTLAPKRRANQLLGELREGLRVNRDGVRAAGTRFIVQELAIGIPFGGMGDPALNHEVRVCCFANIANGVFTARPHATYRQNAGSRLTGKWRDHWVPLRQDQTGVAEYIGVAERVTATLLEKTGAPGALVAVDLFRTEPGGPIRLREANTNDPAIATMMGVDYPNPRIMRELHTAHSHLLAAQLRSLAGI